MAVLEMREAVFAQRGTPIAGPVNIVLAEGRRLAYACDSERNASIVALMAAGLVKPTRGSVFVCAFDARIQPVHVKRIVGFVPHEAVPHEFAGFARYIEYRAALWGLPRAQSIVQARALLAKLDGVHEAFAYPVVGALLAHPKLLVLDRPQAAYAQQIYEAAGDCTILSTHASERDAQRFGDAARVRVS